jgi:hypothetical protein
VSEGALIVMLKTALACVPETSCACTVKVDVPCVVGVPEITPVEAEIINPAGSAPEITDQKLGRTPPVARIVVEYGVPTTPEGGFPETTVSGGTGPEIVIVFAAVTVKGTSLESTIWTTKLDVPIMVGVPDITPVDVLNVSPALRAPLVRLHTSGEVPGVATNVVMYAAPTVPIGGVPLIIGSGLTMMLDVLEFEVPDTAPVSVSFSWLVRPGGAVYVTESPVAFENVPQVLPLQVEPASDHVTTGFDVTRAVKTKV